MESPTTIPELKEILVDRGYEIQYDYRESMAFAIPGDYVISIAWGPLNYCTRLHCVYPGKTPGYFRYEEIRLTNAEIAIWTKQNSDFIRFEGWEGNVKGWVQAPEILRIIDYLTGLPVTDTQRRL